MLCRAVLTAVAISCTFTREVIGQGSPRKVQIKDLICVLWLSGMQKEDLDVNMLRKLQRHNVNIDDMSRETLKQQCLSHKLGKDNATKDVKDKGDDDENKTTTEFVKLDNQKNVKKLLTSDLKMILSNLRDAETIKSSDDKTISVKKEASSKFESLKKERHSENENIQDNIFDMINSPLSGDKTDKFDVKFDISQPKLESIIKFWQTFTTTTTSYNNLDVKVRKRLSKKIRHPVSEEGGNHEQNYFKTETKSRSKETDIIKKLLNDFIYKSTVPTTVKPMTAPIDLKRLSDQIEKLLQLYPQREPLSYSNHLPESEVEVIKMQPDGYDFVKNGIRQKSEIIDERHKQYDTFERSKKNDNIRDSNNQFLLTNIPKNNATIPIRGPIPALSNVQREIAQRYQSIAGNQINFEPTNAPNTRMTETTNKVTIKADGNVITKDCMKEIAENVKAIVLKDLRQEIKLSSITTPVVTTTIFTTTTSPIQPKSSTAQPLPRVTSENPQQNKTQEATQVMVKFMEFFEQFKSIKYNTEITSAMKKLQTGETRQENLNTFNVNPAMKKLQADETRQENFNKFNVNPAMKMLQTDETRQENFNTFNVNPAMKKLQIDETRQENFYSFNVNPPMKKLQTDETRQGNFNTFNVNPAMKKLQTDETRQENFNTFNVNPAMKKLQTGEIRQENFNTFNVNPAMKKLQTDETRQENLNTFNVNPAIEKLQADETRQGMINPFNVNHHVPKVVINPYRDKKPPENLPSLYSPFVERPRLVQNNPLSFSTQSIHRTQAKPITIQTNADEIQPLGIPLSRPLTLIHQNIIITTTLPPVTQRHNRDKWIDRYEHRDEVNRKDRYKHYSIPTRQTGYRVATKPYKDGRLGELKNFLKDKIRKPFDQYRDKDVKLSEFKHQLKDDFISMDQRPYMNAREREFKTYKEDETQLDQKFYDGIPELKDDKLFDLAVPYKDERIPEFEAQPSYQSPHGSYSADHDNTNRLPYKSSKVNVIHLKLNENKKEYGDEHKHVDNISYGLLSHNRNPQRFHEKLERVDDWRSEQRGDTEDKKNKIEVASRQQLPLNTRDTRFDDTHFKNFLKTQQKVNDMLEKILSSKTSQLNGPQSVETT